jgi:hypothetical protein
MTMRKIRSAPILALVLLLAHGCKSSDNGADDTHEAQSPTPSATPVDRLAPGELGASKSNVFGFAVPGGMRVDALFHDAAHLSGRVDAMALARYVRDRVVTGHVEVAAARTTFPTAKIKAGDPKRLYRIEIFSHPVQTQLVIRDITPPPTVEGLTEAERWQRAGMTPTGQLLDPKSLE